MDLTFFHPRNDRLVFCWKNNAIYSQFVFLLLCCINTTLCDHCKLYMPVCTDLWPEMCSYWVHYNNNSMSYISPAFQHLPYLLCIGLQCITYTLLYMCMAQHTVGLANNERFRGNLIRLFVPSREVVPFSEVLNVIMETTGNSGLGPWNNNNVSCI